MAIIYSYPEIPDVQGGDLLLISDTGAPNKPTRSVDIDDLAAYIGTVVGVVQNLQSVLTVGNTYVSPDGYGTFTLNDIANNDGSITFVNTDEGWGYQISAEEGINITDGSGTNLMSIQSSGLSIRNGAQIMNIGTNTLTATRNVYFPDASGTIALTSDLANVVYSNQDADISAEWTFYEDLLIDSSFLTFISNSNYKTNIAASTSLSSNISLTLPSNSGTLALTSDIPAPGPSGSGTTNYTARWTNASTLGIGALYDNGTNVGIGTASPSQKLEVSGNSLVTGTQFIGDTFTKIQQASGNLLLTNQSSSGAIAFLTNSTERVRITSTGNVGIGTTSPDSLLEISTTDTTKNFIKLTSGGGSVNPSLIFEKSTVEQGVIQYIRNGDLKIYNTDIDGGVMISGSGASNYDMYINNSGNVGIGTTSPSSKLQVSANDGDGITLKHGESNAFYILRDGNDDTTIKQNRNYTSKISISTLADSGTHESSGLNIVGQGAGLKSNVGIGTNSPTEKLEVAGNILVSGSNDSADGLHLKDRTFIAFSDAGSIVSRFRSSSTGIFQFQDGSYNTNIVLNTNGNSYLNGGKVGIGTTTPSEKLDVSGNAIVRGDIVARDTYPSIYVDHSGTVMGGIRADATSKLELKTLTTAPLSFQVNSSEKMRILDNGNVGIGTTSPSEKLHVEGDIRLLDELIFGEYSTTTDRITNQSYALTIAHSQSINFKVGTASVFNVYGTQIRPQFNDTIDLGHSQFRWKRGFFDDNILTNGSIGIGIDYPSVPIHIEASDPRIKIVDTDGTNWESQVFTQGGALKLQARNGTNFGNISFQGDNGTTQSEYARFNSVGNFGIGTTSPSEKLEVRGNVYIEGSFPYIKLKQDASGLQEYSIINNGNFTIEKTTSASGGSFLIKDENGRTPLNVSMGLLNPDTVISGDLFVKDKDGTTTKLYVKNENGNVGIGTTAPTTKLQVNGDVRIYDENEIYFGGTGSVPHWEIKASGTDLIINDTGTNVGSVLFNNDEGVVLPRLTTTEINAISLPNTGLTVYNTTLNTLCFYNGSSWQKVSHANM